MPEPGSALATDMAEQPEVVERALAANADELHRARELVDRAGFVRFLGIGSSRHAAAYGALVTETLTGRRTTLAPAPGVGIPLPAFTSDEVVLAVSRSGRTPALCAAAEAARSAGARLIAVTERPDAPLAEDAELTLRCEVGAERAVPATKSVLAQAVLLRAVAAPLDDEACSTLTDAIASVLEADPDPATRTEPCDLVAASGLAGEWVARETALKLAEMAGVSAASGSVVDCLHGLVAAAHHTLALLDPDDPNASALPGDVVRVGPGPGYDLVTPRLDDPTLQPLVALVAGQRVAWAWALRLGVDPDADRGLRKVTCSR